MSSSGKGPLTSRVGVREQQIQRLERELKDKEVTIKSLQVGTYPNVFFRLLLQNQKLHQVYGEGLVHVYIYHMKNVQNVR